jgi:hypothetical protein
VDDGNGSPARTSGRKGADQNTGRYERKFRAQMVSRAGSRAGPGRAEG